MYVDAKDLELKDIPNKSKDPTINLYIFENIKLTGKLSKIDKYVNKLLANNPRNKLARRIKEMIR